MGKARKAEVLKGKIRRKSPKSPLKPARSGSQRESVEKPVEGCFLYTWWRAGLEGEKTGSEIHRLSPGVLPRVLDHLPDWTLISSQSVRHGTA